MSELSPSTPGVPISLSTAELPEHANSYQMDRDVCRAIVQQLASRMTEVLTDPSVINEIAQQERNTRNQFLYSGSLNNVLNSSEIQEPLLQFLRHQTPNLEAESQNQNRNFHDGNDQHDDFLSRTSTVISQNNLNVLQNYSQNLKRKRIAYTLIIVAVLLLVAILASGLTIFIVWVAINSSSILVFDNIFNDLDLTNDVSLVSVGSSDEYNSVVGHSVRKKLAVSIELERPGDWPTGAMIQASKNVKIIRVCGTFHIKKLKSLLHKVSSLEKLELVNRGDLICTESTEPLRLFDKRYEVSISLKHLSLEYFKYSTCGEALRLLCENVEFNSLETILIRDAEINIDNMALYENILYKYRKSLKKLEISGTIFDIGLFRGQYALRFDNIKTLVVEQNVRNSTNVSTYPLGNICSIFPNVETLSFGMAMKHVRELADLLECKKLRSLQIRVWIPYSEKKFSLLLLAKNYPNLKSADLTLSFGNKFPVSDEQCREHFIKVDGKNDLPKLLLANVRVASNCRLKFDD